LKLTCVNGIEKGPFNWWEKERGHLGCDVIHMGEAMMSINTNSSLINISIL